MDKIKSRDEEIYHKFMKVMSQLKDKEISYNSTCLYIDRILIPYPDLLEEAFLYLNHKKLNSSYRKSLINRYRVLKKEDNKEAGNICYKKHISNGVDNESQQSRNLPNSPRSPHKANDHYMKSSNNPEMMFFESLKMLMDKDKYNVFIKLLGLYCNVIFVI